METRRCWVILGLALTALTASATASADGPGARTPLVAILCYHHLTSEPNPKPEMVSPDFLRRQIRACKHAGWSFMSLAELLQRRDRPDSLPPRVMVLTFDDGYRSFLEHAMPILREEGVKATLAVITSWVESPPADLPPLMTWDEIRGAERSGWVEIASHSHDLHHYETSNPYKDTTPSVATRRYVLQEGRYETRDEYRARIQSDLRESQRTLEERLGHGARVLVWPYGEHNQMARGLAAEAGFPVTLALGWRAVTAADLASGCLPRIAVTNRMDFSGGNLSWLGPPDTPIRAADVDLDALYDPDPAVYSSRLDRLIAEVRAAGATHVFLQACPDSRGDGMLRQAWFKNHQIPVKADLWSMVAAKLAQARIRAWIRAPVMNLSWIWAAHPEWRILDPKPRAEGAVGPPTSRVSPDLPEVHRAAIDFYTDLAVYLPIDGVLFDDDAAMSSGERLNGSHSSDPAAKAEAIQELLEDIRGAVTVWRPECRFARSVDSPVVEHRGVHPDFAQDYERILGENRLTVVRAHTREQGHTRDAARWTASVARKALSRWKKTPDRRSGNAPVMLELGAYDRKLGEWVPARELRACAAAARKAGIANLGVRPVAPGGALPARLFEGLSAEGMASRDSISQ